MIAVLDSYAQSLDILSSMAGIRAEQGRGGLEWRSAARFRIRFKYL
ncbi:MAG: hypothetical protein ACR2NN_29845 [Bryobacteraceae bacterium]